MKSSGREPITRFILEHHVLVLATSQNNTPYTAPLFFAYDTERNRFVFATDTKTEHGRQMSENAAVSAGIYLETETVGKVQGLQLTGRVVPADKEDKKTYFGRFPYALAMHPTLWRLEPEWMKLTDNRLGFGNKHFWESEGSES